VETSRQTLGHYVDGQTTVETDVRNSPVFNPATGEKQYDVALADADTVARVIGIAHEAYEQWSRVTPLRRSRVLFKFKELIEQNFDELAAIITREHGKVLSDARGELARGLEVVEFACGIPHLQKGEHSLNVGTGVDSYSSMQPLGVCAGITPFNFPAMVPMWMYPIALACGNSFILKPSEKVPYFSHRMAKYLVEAGLPKGAFNVVNGDKQAVDVLLSDERVKAVSFVGSTPIARYIYEECSKAGKRVQALGGAKNHLVVMPDAEPKGTVGALMGAAYGSAGERCMAVSVAVCVGDDVADRLVAALTAEIADMRVGPGSGGDEEPHMGPLITKEHAAAVTSYIDTGEAEGATLVVDGRGLVVDGHENGFFVGPTLFDHVKKGMRIHSEEIFGPVLCVVRVSSLEEAMELINSHESGNGTSIFTQSARSGRQFSEGIKVGMVGINIGVPVPMAFHCFGGWKRSMFGALNVHGTDGVRFYTQMKTVTQRWPDQPTSESFFSMPTMS